LDDAGVDGVALEDAAEAVTAAASAADAAAGGSSGTGECPLTLAISASSPTRETGLDGRSSVSSGTMA
jgi:hypothetical protein